MWIERVLVGNPMAIWLQIFRLSSWFSIGMQSGMWADQLIYKAAHGLANLAVNLSLDFVWNGICPESIRDVVLAKQAFFSWFYKDHWFYSKKKKKNVTTVRV